MKKISFILLILFFTSEISADDKMILGLKVYNEKAMCGSCHTLKAADSDGAIGPNLDKLKPKISQIHQLAQNKHLTPNSISNLFFICSKFDDIFEIPYTH